MIDKLKAYMKENNLSQNNLARMMDISLEHMSRVMNERAKPGSKMIEAYYDLPGIREKECINKAREEIDDLWLAGEISERTARKILEKLRPGK